MDRMMGFGRFARGAPATFALPPGARAYAIGDVHGRLDLLQQLLGRIDAADAARGDATTHLILLGDLVNSGPDSAGVIRLVQRLAAASRHVRVLKGTHEEMFGKTAPGKIGRAPGWERVWQNCEISEDA